MMPQKALLQKIETELQDWFALKVWGIYFARNPQVMFLKQFPDNWQ